MPLYTPKQSSTDFRGGVNIVASEHLQFISGGATLDPTKFDKGYNEIGKAVARNLSTGLWEDMKDFGGETGEEVADVVKAYDMFGILNNDFHNDGESTLVAGEVIVRGSVYEAKCADPFTDAFKEQVPMIQFLNEFNA